MNTPFVADLEEIVYPTTSDVAEGDLYRIDARRVLAGMFVAELDRPWGDTPLPDSGLLVESDDELGAIRKHCLRVRVDPARSLPGMLDAIKAAAVLSNDHLLTLAGDPFGDEPAAETPAPASSRAQRRRRGVSRRDASWRDEAPPPAARRDDVHPTSEGRGRVRALLKIANEGRVIPERSGAVARLRGWFSGGGTDAARKPRSLEELRARWGDAIGAVEYEESPPIRDSLAEARAAHARLVLAADSVVAQVRQGATPALAALDDAAGAFVDTLQRAPDALRWAEAVYAQNAPRPNPAAAVALNLAGFGRALGMPAASLRELALIGVLLDLGKALLPRELLEQPGVLAPHDFALVQQHVTIGLDLLERGAALAPPVLRAIGEHHERLDGSGYPRRLRGDEIGLYGRMAAIVDAFSGLTALRAYANPLSVEDALSALNEWAGSLFCPDLVERFVLSIGLFPIGTLVELCSGEVAAVIDRPRGTRSHPKLVVMTGTDKGPLRPVRDRTGRQDPEEVYSGASVRIARGLPCGVFGLRLPDYYSRPPER